jgi:hypothetical protein
MAYFIDVHDGFVGVTRSQLEDLHARDLANQDSEGMAFERCWLDPETGRFFCLSQGPSKEALMRVHERSGHPTTEVYEVPVRVS